MGIFAPKSISVGDLFAGAIIPGLCLVGLYLTYILVRVIVATSFHAACGTHGGCETCTGIRGARAPAAANRCSARLNSRWLRDLDRGCGCWRLRGPGSRSRLVGSIRAVLSGGSSTLSTTGMVFFILVGASIFSLVFRGYGGDEMVQAQFEQMPGGMWGALGVVMLVIFLLGFILDFIEITFVVVPIVGPVLMAMGVDPIWLGVLIAVNLQTSF